MSNTGLTLDGCLQWSDAAAPRMRDETHSTLGEDWEDIDVAALTIPSGDDAPPNSNSALTQSDPNDALRSNGLNRAVSCPAEQASDTAEACSSVESAGRERLPSCANGPHGKLEIVSERTARALDEYLDSYSSLESSIDELLLGLDDAHQRSAPDPRNIDDIYNRVAHARSILTTRSNAVKEAKSEWTTLRNAVRQERRSGNCSEVEPWLDDDNSSEVSDASEVPPVVEEYFRVAGEAFVENERLTDLEHEYKELVSSQECDCYRGEDFTPSVINDKVEYKRKREELGIALAIQHYRLHAQKDACLAQGLDPEYYRYRRVPTRRSKG